MRGEKTIEFSPEFNVKFSNKGKFTESTGVVVREPGLGKFEVYTTMSAYVADALRKIYADKSERKQAAPAAAAPAPIETEEPDLDENSDQDVDVLVFMRMGLGPDRYPAFMRYVKNVLTSSPKLANVIGDDKQGLTDEVWESISEGGGMKAVEKVLSEFTGIFFDALDASASPQKKSGAKSSTSSDLPRPATSPTTVPATSRLRKS